MKTKLFILFFILFSFTVLLVNIKKTQAATPNPQPPPAPQQPSSSNNSTPCCDPTNTNCVPGAKLCPPQGNLSVKAATPNPQPPPAPQQPSSSNNSNCYNPWVYPPTGDTSWPTCPYTQQPTTPCCDPTNTNCVPGAKLCPPQGDLSVKTPFGEVNPENLGVVAGQFLRLAVGLAGLFALILILFGGFGVMTSSGQPDKLTESKETITSAIIGLSFIILTITIITVVGKIFQLPGLF